MNRAFISLSKQRELRLQTEVCKENGRVTLSSFRDCYTGWLKHQFEVPVWEVCWVYLQKNHDFLCIDSLWFPTKQERWSKGSFINMVLGQVNVGWLDCCPLWPWGQLAIGQVHVLKSIDQTDYRVQLRLCADSNFSCWHLVWKKEKDLQVFMLWWDKVWNLEQNSSTKSHDYRCWKNNPYHLHPLAWSSSFCSF